MKKVTKAERNTAVNAFRKAKMKGGSLVTLLSKRLEKEGIDENTFIEHLIKTVSK